MRFLMTLNGGGRPPDEQLYAEMGRFVEELTRAGVLLATGGLDRGTHVVASGGNITLTDGPFTESKEVIVSFALIEVRSKDEALELARRFWKVVGDGEGVCVIPAHLANEVAEEAYEQTAYEDFVEERVRAGESIFGLYPANAETKAKFTAWRSGWA